MKIQCDVCEKEEATVFCSADEAALCDRCDRRVHFANKLAEKHLRFSLLHPSFKDFPPCDICQERLAFLFCQEDRAILCRECDLPIHKANEHTQKHNRFLLTGVKLSASSSLYPTTTTSSATSSNHCLIKSSESPPIQNPVSVISNKMSTEKAVPSTAYNKVHDHHINDNSSILTSSISEYLMETLPGWRVDEFLDPSPPTTSHGFCKVMDHDLESNQIPFSSEDLGMWVPQISTFSSPHLPLHLSHTDLVNGFKESKGGNNVKKVSRKQRDDCFTVPQMSSPSLKKSRHLW